MAEPDSSTTAAAPDPASNDVPAKPAEATPDIVLRSPESASKLELAAPAASAPKVATAATADSLAFGPDVAAAAAAVAVAADEATTAPRAPSPREAAGPAPSAGVAAAASGGPLGAYEMLARSARLADLVALTSAVVGEAARLRPSDWSLAPKVVAAANDARLSREDAATPYGNALDVLGSGGTTEAERALAAALWAHVVAESPRSRTEDEDRLAGDVLWLASHTAFDATPLLDRALGEEASDLWAAIAVRVRRIERGAGGALGRAEAIVGCAALAASESPRARQLGDGLAAELRDPVLLRLLGARAAAAAEARAIRGEMLPPPRGPIATTLLACTGLLLAIGAVRVALRVALAYRRPAEVSFDASAIRIKTRTEMLGRVLSEREHVIPRAGLVRVVREVRFPRAAFYAGLLALALGSYVGVRAFVDGVRAASPSLLLVGLLIVAAGVGVDFVLGTLLPGARGKCRVSLVPRTGKVLCIGDVDVADADGAVAAIKG